MNLRSAAIGTTFAAGFAFISGICTSGICASTTASLSVVFGLCVLHVNIVALIIVIFTPSQTLDLEANINFFASKNLIDDFTVALVP